MRSFKRKPPEERHNAKVIYIRLTVAERTRIETKSRLCNLTISEFIRRTALGKSIRTNDRADLILELRVVTERQRELYKTDRLNEPRYQQVLDSCVAATMAIPLWIQHAEEEHIEHEEIDDDTGLHEASLRARLMHEDRKAIEGRAVLKGQTLSGYIRKCALGRKIPASATTAIIAQLRSLLAHQYENFHSPRRNERKYQKTIDDLVEYVRTIPSKI